MVLTGMSRPVLGESFTTFIKDFAIFPPHQNKKNKKIIIGMITCPIISTVSPFATIRLREVGLEIG